MNLIADLQLKETLNDHLLHLTHEETLKDTSPKKTLNDLHRVYTDCK